MQNKLKKEFLGLAGEYAVASELCRRGIYAQLTLGTHKRTDILVETEVRMLRIQVKAKQKDEWPAIAGLYRSDDFLILVDLKGKATTERPDFYILNFDDWKQLVLEEQKRQPVIKIDEKFQITYPDGWQGLNIKPERVTSTKEQWSKITAQVREGETAA